MAILAMAALLAGDPASGSGFSIYQQASKASGLAGAFVAQADDPSAMFFNVGGLGLLEAKPKVSAGVATLTLSESLYQGLAPGVGVGTTGEQSSEQTLLPHAYAVFTLSPKLKGGLAVYSPFAWDTRWRDPDGFSGRFISTRAELTATDFNPNLGYKASDKFGVGAGVIYRTSSLSRSRRVQAENPLTGQLLDIASERVSTSTDDGFGWNVGFLHRPSESFSWGVSYRSEVEVDFQGSSRLTQIPTGNAQLDDVIAGLLPFDQDLAMTTQLSFPELLSLGLAFRPAAAFLVEIDANYIGWSSYDLVEITFPNNPGLDREINENFSDTMSYRMGMLYEFPSGSEIRFGVAFEETPQPDESVDPALPDADRTTFAAGFGKDWLDLAFQWVDLGRRRTVTNRDDFNGNYSTSYYLLSLTVSK